MSTWRTRQPVSSAGGPGCGPGRCNCCFRLTTTPSHAFSAPSPVGQRVQLGGDVLAAPGAWTRPAPGRSARRRRPARRRSCRSAPGRRRPGRRAPRRRAGRSARSSASMPEVKRRGIGSRSPQRPWALDRIRRASSKCPASARCSTAATWLAASTLTAPPGRTVRAIEAIAAAGSSTYSSTLWHSTRSAVSGPTRSSRSSASPCRARTATPASAARRSRPAERVGAGVDDRHVVAQLGERHGQPARAAAGVEDVEDGAAGRLGALVEDLAQDLPHDGAARGPGPRTLAHGVSGAPVRRRPRRRHRHLTVPRVVAHAPRLPLSFTSAQLRACLRAPSVASSAAQIGAAEA